MLARANQTPDGLPKRQRRERQVIVLVRIALGILLTAQLGLLDHERQTSSDHRVGKRSERELVDPDDPQSVRRGDVDALPEPTCADEHPANLLECLNRALVTLDPGRDQRERIAALDAKTCKPVEYSRR